MRCISTISAPGAWCVAWPSEQVSAGVPLLAAGCADGSLALWNRENGKSVGESAQRHSDGVLGLLACPDGLISASYEGVHVWQLQQRAGRWVCEILHQLAAFPGHPRCLPIDFSLALIQRR